MGANLEAARSRPTVEECGVDPALWGERWLAKLEHADNMRRHAHALQGQDTADDLAALEDGSRKAYIIDLIPSMGRECAFLADAQRTETFSEACRGEGQEALRQLASRWALLKRLCARLTTENCAAVIASWVVPLPASLLGCVCLKRTADEPRVRSGRGPFCPAPIGLGVLSFAVGSAAAVACDWNYGQYIPRIYEQIDPTGSTGNRSHRIFWQ